MKEQTEVGKLKEGRYVVIDEEPCSIIGITHSKPGKHGSAKARVEAVGIFDGQKRSIVAPVSNKIYVPIVERKRAQVLSISSDVLTLMNMDDYSTFELKMTPENMGKVKNGEEVQYLTSMGKMKLDIR